MKLDAFWRDGIHGELKKFSMSLPKNSDTSFDDYSHFIRWMAQIVIFFVKSLPWRKHVFKSWFHDFLRKEEIMNEEQVPKKQFVLVRPTIRRRRKKMFESFSSEFADDTYKKSKRVWEYLEKAHLFEDFFN